VTARQSAAPRLSKVATGIQGFDELSRGGLPRNRTSLVMGGPGAALLVDHQPRCIVIDPRISPNSDTNVEKEPQRGP
jgi:KaiC